MHLRRRRQHAVEVEEAALDLVGESEHEVRSIAVSRRGV